MEFVHRTYDPDATIAAIVTPPGEGAVAIIRISGKETFAIGQKIFSGPVSQFASHTVHFGKILNAQRQVVDEVLLVVMRSPRSYTGEDTIEIQCHGGSLITRKVLEVVIEAGARAALPGEFTLKAFVNGKLDLAQAEAVQQLIGAKNELSLQAAEKQLQGGLSAKIKELQQELVDIAAILEAWVDFPEEGLEFASQQEIIQSLQNTYQKMEALSITFHDGKIIHEGLTLALIGSPNVGKSSLMNFLLKKDRAIVSPIAGTTRDILEDEMRLGGLHFRLIDTAGIRQTEELIEQEGIKRSKQALKEADLVLLVLDASRPVTKEDADLLKLVSNDHTIVIWNKIDLPHQIHPLDAFKHQVPLSAKSGEGMVMLSALIQEIIWKNKMPAKDEVVITNLRHKEALDRAMEYCTKVINGLNEGVSAEFVAYDMRSTLLELGTIIGTNITEDILSAIFSKFCVGK